MSNVIIVPLEVILSTAEDILESFLSDYRDKREQHAKATLGDEEFMTPELPRGRELVLHILSTWGDRFYVGLTGVEIYTVTGELAQVEQVSVTSITGSCVLSVH